MIVHSSHFGVLEIEESSTLEFPHGLPGFEKYRRFAALEHPARAGLIFLQSLEQPELCLVAVPAKALRPDYELALSADDQEILGLDGEGTPLSGSGLAALAVVSFVEGEEPTANLLAPIVIELKTRRAVQAIRPDGRYQVKEALSVAEPVCS